MFYTVNPASSSYIQDNGCNLNSANPAGTWYTATDKMAIRMNFGYVNNINERGENSDFNIYPNPTNGLFHVTFLFSCSSQEIDSNSL